MMKNQLKIGVLLSYVSTGLNMVVQLVYTPIMIQLLGQSEYGLYTLVGSVVSYLNLFSLGFTGAYLRFYTRYSHTKDTKGEARLNGMFLSLFGLMGAAALVCGMILAQFTPQVFGTNLTQQELETAKLLMEILVLNIVLTFPNSLFDSIVSAHEQFFFQRVLYLLGIVCNPLIALPLLLLGYGSVAMVCVTTFITIAKIIVNVWYCFKKLHIKFYFREFDFSLLREMGAFSFFLFFNMVIDQINWSVGKFILGRVSGTAAVAVYGVSTQINSLFISFSTAISSVFAPRVNRIATAQNKTMAQQFTDLMIRVGRIQFMVLGLFMTGFLWFGSYFITNLYATPAYAEAYPASLWLLLPAMIPLIQNLGIEIQRAQNQHRFRSLIYLGMALLNVLISIPLSIWFGPVGTAMGTGVSLLVANGLVMNVYYQKKMGLDMTAFWKSILRLGRGLIVPLLAGVAIYRWVQLNSLKDFAFWVILYAVIYAGSLWLLGMNREEKNLVANIIKRVTVKGK